MAVVDVSGASILSAAQAAQLDLLLKDVQIKNPTLSINALLKSVAVGATNSNGSKYRLFENMAPTVKPLLMNFGGAGNTSGTGYDLGIYDAASTALIDNCFASGVSLATAHDFLSPSGALNGMSAVPVIPKQTAMQAAATGTGNGTVLNVVGAGVANLSITGTFVGTVTFESSVDGSTWVALTGQSQDRNATADATHTSRKGNWQFTLGGFIQIRARISAYTSGAITVNGVTSGIAALWQYAADLAATTKTGYDIVVTADTGGSAGDTIKGLIIYA